MPFFLRHPESAFAVALVLVACGDSETDPEVRTTTAAAAVGGATASGTTGGGNGDGGAGTGAAVTGVGGGGGGGGAGTPGDFDGDGLDDTFESDVATTYLPFLSLPTDDECPLSGILYRVSPQPDHPSLLHVRYLRLFEHDCGLNGHLGDVEAFGITVDPSQPPPDGVLAMKAIGHMGTFCEHVTECGSCAGLAACPTTIDNGNPALLVLSSKNKHAHYVDPDKCSPWMSCFDTCTLTTPSAVPPMVNAGEQQQPLTNNLTTNGFVTADNGWIEPQLMDFDPWNGTASFGTAGPVVDELVAPDFIAGACP